MARTGYRLRFPSTDRDTGTALIVPIVASLLRVAAVTAALPGAQRPTQIGYVLVLLGWSLFTGFALALARGAQRAQRLLRRIGYRLLRRAASTRRRSGSCDGADSEIIVELKDRRVISGTPSCGPQHEGDGIRELYLTHPSMRDNDSGDYRPIGAGVIVPLSEVSTVTLFEDPTGLAQIDDRPQVPPQAPTT